MSNVTIVTRFAPSPTGFVHIGGIRTALYNWALARRHGGKFLLRIEDTDRERFVPGAEEQLKASLRAMNLNWDEGPDVGGPAGPYVQSERMEIYRKHAMDLLARGHLYKCWCTKERLDLLKADQEKSKLPFGYDRHCRHLSDAARAELDRSGAPYVLRLNAPTEGQIVVDDVARGRTPFECKTIGDRVMFKSDGTTLYHFASVVDDHEMGVTHVMRGDEWLSSTPIHLYLYQCFGWNPPQFAHLAPVLGSKGKKLSKRNNDASVDWYLDQGYLPEALLNILALSGWNPGADLSEFMTLDQIAERFDLTRVGASGAVFDTEKLEHFNGLHIRNLSVAEFVSRMTPYLVQAGFVGANLTNEQAALIGRLAPLVQARIKLMTEVVSYCRGIYETPVVTRSSFALKKLEPEAVCDSLSAVSDKLRVSADFNTPALEWLKALSPDKGVNRELMAAVRMAITGSAISLPLFETIDILGRDEVIERLNKAVAALREPTVDSGTAA